MRNLIKTTAIALAATGMAATAVPAAAANLGVPAAHHAAAVSADHWDNGNRGHYQRYDRDDRRYDGRYDRDDRRYDRSDRRDYRRYDSNYGEPVRRDTRVWRGRDGHAYCRKSDGTTGLIIGAAAGALLGREIDSRGDRTLGTILGGAAGALLGRSVDSGTRCR